MMWEVRNIPQGTIRNFIQNEYFSIVSNKKKKYVVLNPNNIIHCNVENIIIRALKYIIGAIKSYNGN